MSELLLGDFEAYAGGLQINGRLGIVSFTNADYLLFVEGSITIVDGQLLVRCEVRIGTTHDVDPNLISINIPADLSPVDKKLDLVTNENLAVGGEIILSVTVPATVEVSDVKIVRNVYGSGMLTFVHGVKLGGEKDGLTFTKDNVAEGDKIPDSEPCFREEVDVYLDPEQVDAIEAAGYPVTAADDDTSENA
jgi:hypothetical protein